MPTQFYLLDTCTTELFKGNPTPVCLTDRVLNESLMHSLAIEFNAPVTTFVEPAHADSKYRIRYFTITGEIPACGHATIGAASVLLNRTPGLTFETIENRILKAGKEGDAVFIDYPVFGVTEFDLPKSLLDALGLSNLKNHFYCAELESLFIELDSEKEVAENAPDFKALVASADNVKEVVIMSQSSQAHYDVTLRSYCPWIGIDEDPVTGSIHSALGPYWQKKLNKNKLKIWQASSRGGSLEIIPKSDHVAIGGQVRMITMGELTI